jgi:hypothetical protein
MSRYRNVSILYRSFLISAAVLLFGCATPPADSQRRLAFAQFLEDYGRLNRVGFNIERAAAPYCSGNLRYGGGLILAYPGMAKAEFSAAAADLLGGPGLVVHAIAPGSPGEHSGFRVGDVVTAINGHEASDPLRALAVTAPDHHDSWVVRRGGTERTITYDSVRLCDYRIALAIDDERNAMAGAEDGGDHRHDAIGQRRRACAGRRP